MRQINILSLKSRTTKVILAVLSSSLACGMPNVFSNLLQAQQMANIVKAVFATLSSMRFFSEREDHRSTLQNFADDEHAPVSRLRLESDYLHVSETSTWSQAKFQNNLNKIIRWINFELISRTPPNSAVKVTAKLSTQGGQSCFLTLIFTLFLASNTFTMG
jgi:hypothetical protein